MANRRASLSDRIAQFDYNSSDSDEDETVHPPVLAPAEAPPIDSPPPIYKDASLPPHEPTIVSPPTYVFSNEAINDQVPSESGVDDPSIELDHVWENQWRHKASLLSTSKATSEWLPTGKKQGRSAFESPSEGLSELFEHYNGPPPGVLEHVGLPSRSWRWLGPWILDLGDLKACDRTRADGSAVGSDAEWFCADAWPSRNSEAGSEDAGYYPARDATAKTTVRCRRWVRPRERRPDGLAGRGAHITSLASASDANGSDNDDGDIRKAEAISPTETASLAAADAQRLNDLLAYGSDSDNESLSGDADQSKNNATNTGALLAEAINDSDEPLSGNFSEAHDRTVSASTASTSSTSNSAADGGSKTLESGSSTDDSSTEGVPKVNTSSNESLSGLAGAASWARSMRSRGEALAMNARLKAEALMASQKKSGDITVNGETGVEGGKNNETPPPEYETWSFGDALVKDDADDDLTLQHWDCVACAFRNHVPVGAPRVCEMCETMDSTTESSTEATSHTTVANDSQMTTNGAAVATSPPTPALPAAPIEVEPDLVVDFVWQNERWVPLRKSWVPSASFIVGIPTKKRPSFEACRRPSDQGAGLVQLFEAHNGPPTTSESQLSATTNEPAANLAEIAPASAPEETVPKETNFRLELPTSFMSNTLKMSKLSLGSLSKSSTKGETVSGGALGASMAEEDDDEDQPGRTALRHAEVAALAEGLPSASWRWVGPWLIDSENFGVDRVVGDMMSDPESSSDQSRGKGGSSDLNNATYESSSSDPGGGWLYGGFDWPKHDVGYSRTGGRSKLVRCRRWVRPRERISGPPLEPAEVENSSKDDCDSGASASVSSLASPLSSTVPQRGLNDLQSPPSSPLPPEFDVASNTWVRKTSALDLNSSAIHDAPPSYSAVTDTQQAGEKVTAQVKSNSGLSAEDIANLEYDVLLEFYHQCSGASWQKSKGWALATRPVSDWTGITVVTETVKAADPEHASSASELRSRNKVLRVSGVNLSRNSLSGCQVPWEAISELQSLTCFDLSHNNLRGGLPLSFHLHRCTKLDLSFNKLTGPLPAAFVASLPCLESLCLSSNALTGEVPWEALQKMAGLKLLTLDSNDFAGPIPENFDGTLEELKLANNPKLEAFIKETSAFATFAQLPHLRRFDLFELP